MKKVLLSFAFAGITLTQAAIGSPQILDSPTYSRLQVCPAHQVETFAVEPSHGEQLAVVCSQIEGPFSERSFVRIYDTETMTNQLTLTGPKVSLFSANNSKIAYTPESGLFLAGFSTGEYLAASYPGQGETKTGKVAGGEISAIAFQQDGSSAYLATITGRLHKLDLATWTTKEISNVGCNCDVPTLKAGFTRLAVTSNGLYAATTRGEVYTFDLITDAVVEKANWSRDAIHSLVVDEDRNLAITHDNAGTLAQRSLSHPEEIIISRKSVVRGIQHQHANGYLLSYDSVNGAPEIFAVGDLTTVYNFGQDEKFAGVMTYSVNAHPIEQKVYFGLASKGEILVADFN